MIAQSVVSLSHLAMCFVYIVCLGEALCKFVTSIPGLVLLEIKCSHYQHAVLYFVMTIHPAFPCFNHEQNGLFKYFSHKPCPLVFVGFFFFAFATYELKPF